MHGQPIMSIAWLRDPFNPVRNKNGDAMRIEIDPADLLPLIEQVVSETIWVAGLGTPRLRLL